MSTSSSRIRVIAPLKYFLSPAGALKLSSSSSKFPRKSCSTKPMFTLPPRIHGHIYGLMQQYSFHETALYYRNKIITNKRSEGYETGVNANVAAFKCFQYTLRSEKTSKRIPTIYLFSWDLALLCTYKFNLKIRLRSV